MRNPYILRSRSGKPYEVLYTSGEQELIVFTSSNYQRASGVADMLGAEWRADREETGFQVPVGILRAGDILSNGEEVVKVSRVPNSFKLTVETKDASGTKRFYRDLPHDHPFSVQKKD